MSESQWARAVDPAGIARFVDPAIAAKKANLVLPESSYDLSGQKDGRRCLVQLIYEGLLGWADQGKPITYERPEYNYEEIIQTIRTPDEILVSPRQGTCLDLSLLFAGICLHYGLLPLVILVQGHAYVAINMGYSRTHDLQSGWSAFGRKELIEIEKCAGLIKDGTTLAKWIEESDYLPVECTGFAYTSALPVTFPEGRGRDKGYLSFKEAVVAGKAQLTYKERPFHFAADIHYLQQNGVRPSTTQKISAQTDDDETLESANAKLAELPVDSIPPVATLPHGSRILYSRNLNFVGREKELLTLAANLKGDDTSAVGKIAAITGLGGIGKTQLAVAFVHHYGRFFQGGVYWLSFANPESVPEEIAACGMKMSDLRTDYASLERKNQVSLVQTAWESPLPRLLIFDNCEDPALLRKWQPRTGESRILLTSRLASWEVLGVPILALDTLTRSQSIELVCKFCPDLRATDSNLDQIADELGDLPLALHMAGSYLALNPTTKPEYYLAQLRQLASLQVIDRTPQARALSPTDHVQSVRSTFALSYNQLSNIDPIDRLARTLLALAACFAHDVIPINILLASIESNNDRARGSFSFRKFILNLDRFIKFRRERVRRERDSGEDISQQAEQGLRRLVDLGLLEQGTEGARLHRLVAHFVQETDVASMPETQTAVESALLKEATQIYNSGLPLALLPWQVHLRYVTDNALRRSDKRAADLCNALGCHLSEVRDYASAKPYLEQALAIRKAVLGKEHPDTATSYNNIGSLLKESGDLVGAKPKLEQALAINESVFGKNHPTTANSYNNLGSLLQDSGDLAAAKSYYMQALAIREAVLGKEHPDTATSYNNIGGLLKKSGDLAGAKSYYERVLAIRRSVFGDKHPDTASSYNNLGSLFQDMGSYAAAKSYYKQAIDIYEAVEGKKHPDTANSYNNLGRLLQDMGDLTSARPYLEQALAINEAVLGKKHPATATSYNNIGGLLEESGDLAGAKPYLEQALAIRRSVFGDEHPATAGSYHNLGSLLKESGDLAGAKSYYERALAIFEEVFGKEHPDTAHSYNNLGSLLQDMGDLAGAKSYYEQALAIYKVVAGVQNPATALSYNNLGSLLQTMGDLVNAKPYFERALAIFEESLGMNHPSTQTVRNNLAALERLMKR